MSRKAPAVQFYAEDFLNGTRFMSNAEVGLYIRLLAEQIDKGSLPDNVEHFVKAYGKECRKLWPSVRSKFVDGPEAGTIVNERMATAIAARDAFRKKQSEKGTLSAISRSTMVKPRKRRGSTVVEPLGDGVGDNTTLSGKERARKVLFANSKYSDPEVAKAELLDLIAKGANIAAICEDIRNWSDAKDERRTDRGWLATYRTFHGNGRQRTGARPEHSAERKNLKTTFD